MNIEALWVSVVSGSLLLVVGIPVWRFKQRSELKRNNRRTKAKPLAEQLEALALNIMRTDWAMVAILDNCIDSMEVEKDRLWMICTRRQARKLDKHWKALSTFHAEVRAFNKSVFGDLPFGDVLPQFASADTEIEQELREQARPIVEGFRTFVQRAFIDR
ncbi:MAG: hypothetical protein JW819_14185 [Candidatus Krumholzibacteriota bacterium]|nr:hypothetical protein [Candidatus Krumholzibacteriota bacterium]